MHKANRSLVTAALLSALASTGCGDPGDEELVDSNEDELVSRTTGLRLGFCRLVRYRPGQGGWRRRCCQKCR